MMASLKTSAIGIILFAMAGCAAQGGAAPQPNSPAAAASTKCTLNTAKVCADSQGAGTLEPPPRSMGYAMPQNMPDTAHLAIPNGPTLQVMCYYNPQHTSLSNSDWNSSAGLDDNAAAYLASKGYCNK